MDETGNSTAADFGVLVVGHGTASPIGAEESRRVAEMVAELLPQAAVELGFLEVIEPSIDDALRRLAKRGVRGIVVAPLLLFAAGHARRDVPEAVRLAAEARGVRVLQADVLGCHPAIVALARRRHAEAVGGGAASGFSDAPQTSVLVVGRGASDPSAAAQLQAFSAIVFSGPGGDPGPPVRFGFVAAARPSLDEAIEQAATDRAKRVVVHPHLLFHGHVESQVAARVDQARRDHPGIEWRVVARLGADPAVARAVADRVRAALADGPTVPAAAVGSVPPQGFGIA